MAKEGGIGDFTSLAKSFGAKASGALKGLGGVGASAASNGMQKLTGGFGLKTNLALGAAAGAGLLGGSKLLNKATRVMGAEAAGPATYGGAVHGVGYVLPYGVNQYGQPQVGTSL
jgi:hypothetical protein